MLRVAIVGLGKMGLSHLAILRAHPEVDLVGACDTSGYVLSILHKYSGLPIFTDFATMLDEAKPEAVLVATPSKSHGLLVKLALERGIHVFCEKPFCLDPAESQALAGLAAAKGLVTQVGYHYRFVGAFQQVKRVLDAGGIGKVTHVLAEAYGPVVLRPQGKTWRTQKDEGGGCLYDYVTHPVNLLNWFFGAPQTVTGSMMKSVFSKDTDDEVYSTIIFPDGISAQLSVNWSDESYRKMSVKISVIGTQGRIYADRQECQVYQRKDAPEIDGYTRGWNVRYTTDLTNPVWFYLRGEEYSAQIDYFIRSVIAREPKNLNSFATAAQTDQVLAMIARNAQGITEDAAPATQAKRSFFRR